METNFFRFFYEFVRFFQILSIFFSIFRNFSYFSISFYFSEFFDFFHIFYFFFQNFRFFVLISFHPWLDGALSRHQPLLIRQNLVIDTTGAGDAFCGGFISHILLKNGRQSDGSFELAVLEDAIEKGHWAAREIIQRYGCSFPVKCSFDAWKKGIPEADCPRANA